MCRAAIDVEKHDPKADYRDVRVRDECEFNGMCTYCNLGYCLRAKRYFIGACEAFEIALKRKSCDAQSLMKFAECLLKVKSAKIGISREKLLKMAAKAINRCIAQKFNASNSMEAAVRGNKEFMDTRSMLYRTLRECCNEQGDYSGAKAASVAAAAYDDVDDDDDDDDDDCNYDDDNDDDDDDDDDGDGDNDDDGDDDENDSDYKTEDGEEEMDDDCYYDDVEYKTEDGEDKMDDDCCYDDVKGM